MNTPEEYISGTKSAVITLLDGMKSYCQILGNAPKPMLRGHTSFSAEEFDKEFNSWRAKNVNIIELSHARQREFFAEEFAFNALCGSLLQIAAMGIQLFSTNRELPEDFPKNLKPLIKNNKALNFCVGRKFRKLPIGLLIYAGRNQYSHMDEEQLRNLNKEILNMLLPDPYSSSLNSTKLMSFSIRITGLLGWRTYESYQADMHSLIISS